MAGGRLIPSITVTIFFGSQEWDGPLSLFDMAANEKRFREVERRAADVIEAITNSGIKYDESEEVVNVCRKIQTFGFLSTSKLLSYPNYFIRRP